LIIKPPTITGAKVPEDATGHLSLLYKKPTGLKKIVDILRRRDELVMSCQLNQQLNSSSVIVRAISLF